MSNEERRQAAPARGTAALDRAQPPRQPAAHGTGAPFLLGPVCIIALGVVLYANSLSIPFLFDDYFEIVNNPTVTVIEPLGSYLNRSRGLTELSFAINYQWSAFDVWTYHLINIAIHLINGLLVYALVRRTLSLPTFGGRYRRHAGILAMLVGLIFVAHPLQTMAVSYIVQRAESLASLFYLLTLWLVAAGAAAPPGRPRRVRFIAAGGAALLGVASKEIAATVAATVMLYAVCFLRPPQARAAAPAPGAAPDAAARSPWLRRAVVAAVALIPLLYGLRLSWLYLTPALEPFNEATARAWFYVPSAGFRLEGITWWRYLITQFGVIVWYLRLFLLPTQQCFDYGWPLAESPWQLNVLAPLLVLLALVAAALAAWRRYPLATFCLGWFFITIAPASSIIPLRDAAFEHRMYLPMVGLSWLLIVGGFDALDRLAAARRLDPTRLRRTGAVVAGLWIAALAVGTMIRNEVLADPLALAEDSARKAPGNWRAQFALGNELADRDRVDEAIAALEEAVRLNPTQGTPRVRLGALYAQRQRLDDAEQVLLPATELSEESVRAAAYAQLGSVYLVRGDLDRAEDALKSASKLKPDWSNVRRQLGSIYYRKGFWYLAAGHYNAAIRYNPKLAPRIAAEASRANVLAAVQIEQRGQHLGAAGLLRKALIYQPQLTPARHYLAYVYANSGNWPRAQAEMETVAREQPDDPQVRANLERARQQQPLEEPKNVGG